MYSTTVVTTCVRMYSLSREALLEKFPRETIKGLFSGFREKDSVRKSICENIVKAKGGKKEDEGQAKSLFGTKEQLIELTAYKTQLLRNHKVSEEIFAYRQKSMGSDIKSLALAQETEFLLQISRSFRNSTKAKERLQNRVFCRSTGFNIFVAQKQSKERPARTPALTRSRMKSPETTSVQEQSEEKEQLFLTSISPTNTTRRTEGRRLERSIDQTSDKVIPYVTNKPKFRKNLGDYVEASLRVFSQSDAGKKVTHADVLERYRLGLDDGEARKKKIEHILIARGLTQGKQSRKEVTKPMTSIIRNKFAVIVSKGTPRTTNDQASSPSSPSRGARIQKSSSTISGFLPSKGRMGLTPQTNAMTPQGREGLSKGSVLNYSVISFPLN
eukprot:TRINITY_DN10413_c0_g1_i1.p1 TRINITY_DN10413_c0_g1~~TRINITY_DN10413_c0_g1_i1.p1  ORF type:complete len:386 (-),score=84.89 TRINITY_DN10413_c0_g1_i1:83-1240(-)